jgi:hypothetical protein
VVLPASMKVLERAHVERADDKECQVKAFCAYPPPLGTVAGSVR